MTVDYQGQCAVYEDLRCYVLGGAVTFSRPPGLDLFLKKGFLGWSKAQKEIAWVKPLNTGTEKKKHLLRPAAEEEIILVLANMILAERDGNVSAKRSKTKSHSS